MEAVAREAGVSKALVHYYFSTRTELLRAAFHYSEDRANAQTEAELALLDTGAERLQRALELDLDEDPVFRENLALWSGMWSLMQVDARLQPEVERRYRDWTDRLLELVEEGHADRSIPRRVAAEPLVRRLTALVDGLESQLLLGLVSDEEAREVVRDAVDRELGRKRPKAQPPRARGVSMR